MTPLLTLRDLRKSMGGRPLLDIPEFAIPQQSCMVLSGPNGAGKTTLLKILAGLEAPDRCQVDYQGECMPWRTARDRLRRDVVYLHQHPYMLDRDVAENLAYGLRHAGTPKDLIPQRVAQALEWVGLAHLAQRNARQLSGGEQQRVALTRARVLSPRLLLLDEPVANMDLESRRHTFSLILTLKREGIASIVTSHEPQVGRVIGDLHRHLCKTGPCRYTIVEPFLYHRHAEQDIVMAQADKPPPDTERRRDSPPSPRQRAVGVRAVPRQAITGVIMAGGKARRMGGEDKGLLEIRGKPMIQYVLETLRPQVGQLLISANRNQDRYRELGCPVVADISGDYLGPLVGMASALQACDSEYLLTVPCDSPLLPHDLAQLLFGTLDRQQAEISVAYDGQRMQPVFALLRRSLLPSLLAYLDHGGRKIDTWYAQHDTALADCSGFPDAFLNVNTPQEKQLVERKLTDRSR